MYKLSYLFAKQSNYCLIFRLLLVFTLFSVTNQGLFSQSVVRVGNRTNDYNIIDFGAIPDTVHLCTKAINAAINQCHLNGGGRVVIPPGDFLSGTLFMKSNVELYLSSGACLYASKNAIDFPQLPQPEYRSMKDKGGWYALIYAEKEQNISITGKV